MYLLGRAGNAPRGTELPTNTEVRLVCRAIDSRARFVTVFAVTENLTLAVDFVRCAAR